MMNDNTNKQSGHSSGRDLDHNANLTSCQRGMTSQMPDISPIQTCMQSFKDSRAFWDCEKFNLFKHITLQELKEQSSKQENGFCLAISLHNGTILYNSNAITEHLGYSTDMLIGQSLITFLYQKDHMMFASYLTQGLNACLKQPFEQELKQENNTFFCRLRVYNPMKSKENNVGQKLQFSPFKITLHFQELIHDGNESTTLCIKASATPLISAYLAPKLVPVKNSFTTRHTASCYYSHVDDQAIAYLGYLPQDMIGYSIFDFYNSADMHHLKEIYRLVVEKRGVSFTSKPYRFKIYNGDYITLQTEWSCFINPWSKKLEFVVGQHHLIQGPTDTDIFRPSTNEKKLVSDKMMDQCLNIQKEIRTLLDQPVQDLRSNGPNQKQDTFFFDGQFSEGKEKLIASVPQHISGNYAVSDPDSVEGVSPHGDSSLSSESPPTLQELRFQENMERFFASRPKTFVNGFDEKLSNSDESGGNTSKEQESSVPSTSSSNYGNKQQENSSNSSSKGNSSSFTTTGDSGFSNSQKNVQTNTGKEKTQACMKLTEKSLSQHNRLNYKYVKHRKHKDIAIIKGVRNIKHKRVKAGKHFSNMHKQKKNSHMLDRVSTATVPTQTDNVQTTTVQNYQGCCIHAPHGMAFQPVPITSGFGTNGSTTCAFIQPNQQPGGYSAPFYVPVMLMGSFNPFPNMMQEGTVPICPYVPPNPQPKTSLYPNPFLPGTDPAMQLNNYPQNTCVVQSSGATATTTVLTTTTTVASNSLTKHQNSCEGKIPASVCKSDLVTTCGPNDCEMQIEDSSAFSLSSFITDNCLMDNVENMDSDSKSEDGKYGPTDREDPPWLNLTPDKIYHYQLDKRNVDDILRKDLESLKNMTQPDMVNKQLEMLRKDFGNDKKDASSSENDAVLLGLTMISGEKEEMLDQGDIFFFT